MVPWLKIATDRPAQATTDRRLRQPFQSQGAGPSLFSKRESDDTVLASLMAVSCVSSHGRHQEATSHRRFIRAPASPSVRLHSLRPAVGCFGEVGRPAPNQVCLRTAVIRKAESSHRRFIRAPASPSVLLHSLRPAVGRFGEVRRPAPNEGSGDLRRTKPRPVFSPNLKFALFTLQFSMAVPPWKQEHGHTAAGKSLAPRLKKAMAL